MVKIKTSTKQKNFTQKLTSHKYLKHFQNKQLVLETLFDCLVRNDIESFRDVLVSYLRNVPKSDFARVTKLGRQTIYDLIDDKKTFNPTLSTLGSIFEKIAA